MLIPMIKKNRTLQPDPALAMQLAAECLCDPRTAAKAIRGEYVSPLVRARLQIAAARLGVTIAGVGQVPGNKPGMNC